MSCFTRGGRRPARIRVHRPARIRVRRPARIRVHLPARIRVRRPARIRVRRPARIRVRRPARIRVHLPARIRVRRPARIRVHQPARIRVRWPARIRVHRPARIESAGPPASESATRILLPLRVHPSLTSLPPHIPTELCPRPCRALQLLLHRLLPPGRPWAPFLARPGPGPPSHRSILTRFRPGSVPLMITGLSDRDPGPGPESRLSDSATARGLASWPPGT
jgi:hypothetical protein